MSPFNKAHILFWISIIAIFGVDYFSTISIWIYFIPIISFFILLCFGSARMSLNLFHKAYTNPQSTEKLISITFDDGPDENTLGVLDVLKSHNIKATFFCIGHKIEQYPEVMKKIVAEGHIVGNHSYSHSNWFPFFSKKKVLNEIQKTDTLIKQFTKQPFQLFRPPFGVMNQLIASALDTTNHKLIGWNLRSYDGVNQNAEHVIDRLKSKLKPNSVVLLHDDRKQTKYILEEFLQHAESKTYSFVTLPKIFNLKV